MAATSRQHGKKGPAPKTGPSPRMHGPKQRRSLSNIGGPVALSGHDALEKDALAAALGVAGGDDDSTRAHVHGFHSYPARMHPTTARRLIERLSPPRAAVLDPFCGSGTVLVEGLLAGRTVVGVDANPLAVELAWLKTRGTTSTERAQMIDRARAVALSADERRKRRAGATRRYGSEDVALFDPHVLLELDGLVSALRTVDVTWVRRALALVLSSILVKVSRQQGDTSRARGERRLASGFTLKLFQNKTTELAGRLADFQSLMPAAGNRGGARTTNHVERGAAPVVHLGDARRLEAVRPRTIDLVVTSPPYPGTYDYLAHHAARLRWLGLDAERFAEIELGARRHLERLSYGAAFERFKADLGACVSAMARTLAPSGRIVLILADSVLQGRAVYADRLIQSMVGPLGLEITAVGSQARPHFHEPSARAFAQAPRREHAIVCRRTHAR